ncbi:hypothetical protein JKF63_06231 [Porcisia hertigi]|uniref:Sister chromatid cohesion protein n=1 Tax=Porcisia hertigi TaxID=2761500 RepID=A0A836LER3_9TRYP|nr:hypothetical protein JKF63_06231 [Porcisia hertigi]
MLHSGEGMSVKPVVPLPPQPCLIAADESVNPLPKLLLSFPVPRLVSQLRLEMGCARSEEEETPDTGLRIESPASSWQVEELDHVSQGMQESAQQLFLTGAFSHFFQEQFHHEVGPPLRERGGGAGDGDAAHRSQGRGYAALWVSHKVSSGIQGLFSCNAHQNTLPSASRLRRQGEAATALSSSVPPAGKDASRHRVPLTRVPDSESWVAGEDAAAVAFRSRRSTESGSVLADLSTDSRSSVPAAGASSIPASGRRRASATVASTPTTSGTAVNYKPRTAPVSAHLESLGMSLSATDESANAKSISFAEFVRQACSDDEGGVVTCNVPLLLGYVSWLPLQVRPFDGIPSEQLTACLTTLAASGTGAEEAAAGSSCNSGLHGSLWSVRMWLCCQCLAHPHFPTEAAPVELVGRAVDAFARVIRHVAALLSQAQQSADAAAAEGNTVAGTTHVWHPSSALGRGSGVADELTTASLFPWLEQLRGYLRSFAVMLYNRTVQLVPATDVYRLEELCYQCLFYVTRTCSEKMHLLYGTYITDSAVHLYQCIWNRLQMGRQRSVEMFFQRLPLSSAGLMHRSYRVNYYERAVLPLTVAMLSGAQSLVISGEVSELVTVETLQRQCNLWTSAFVHELLLGRCVGEGGRVGDTAAVRVAEDLVDLLGLPEWPGADMLLHAFVRALAQLCLGAESATATATAASTEALRLLAVDVVAHVALKLFDERQSSLPISLLAEVERLRESSASSQVATCVRLQQVLRVPAPAHPAPDDQQAWERMCGAPGKAAASNPDAADLALLGMMVSVYMAESQLISNPSTTADFAAVWLHVRAAQLTTWAALQDNDQRWLSQAALATLVRWQRPPGVGDAPVNWTDVCAWTQAISTQLRNSMLNLRTRHTLVSLLLSISRFTDAQEVAVPVSDAVQKRTLAYLARLGAVYPPLHRHLWPVARQCVQDDSARVRESIVPLLVTILNAATVTATEGELAAATDYYVATADGVTAEVVSSLLCLLGDKSAAVVSRTIAALSTFLTDEAHQGLLVTPHGAPLLSFIQQKLLQLAAPDDMEAQRHQEEVVKHFLRRWVVALGDTVGSLTGADAQLAKELVALAVMGAPDYPHDLSEDHPLVRLLRDMHAYVAAYDSAGETPSSTANAPTAAAVRRRPRGNHIDRARLLHVMRCAARSLWTRYTCFHSVEDAVSSLAALRALAQAHSEWVQPLAEVLVQSITYPPPSTSPLAKAPDALGGALVHMCQTLHAVLKAPRLPLVSLDQLARCLTVLLSKYVGPYQQRVIVASCGALCALITCGAKHPCSAQVNVPYLQLCYSLMNTYYTRVRGLLPNLATQPQSVAYTQRFLFLLSEFLRMYPGWKQHPPHPALEEESLVSHEKGVAGPNALISGSGIMANVYQLLEDVLGSCGSAAAQKGVAVIALRVMASLCLLDPATYFFRAQGHIREALRSHDINFQLQGLSLLSDFLKEEDKRVEMAARQATRLNTTALILGSNSGDGGGNSSDTSSGSQGNSSRCDAPLPSGRVKRTRRRRAATADVQKQMRAGANARRGPPAHFSAAGHTEDFNSGMSTWVFQHFHGDIARLSCGTPSSQVRALSLRLFQQAAHGGLLPPDKYMQAIVALAADVHAPLRQQAGSILAVHSERHEEVVGMSIGRGVVLAYRLHHICDVNLLFSAVVPEKPLSAAPAVESEAGDVLNGYSVHSTVYALLHKRLRDSMVTTLVRFFYDDGRVRSWCEEHVQLLADASKTLAAPSSSGDIFHLFHPLSFLCHMTLALATLPFQHESDVMHVLKQARNGLDLCGQEALDWLMDGEISGTLPLCTDVSASTLMQWKAIGAVLLHYLRRSLKLEYRLSSAKLTHCPNRQNHRAANRGAPHYTLSQLPRNATHTAARADLIARIERLVHILDPALRGTATSHSSADVVGRGWHALGVELQAALLEESGDEFRKASPLLCSPGVREKDKTAPAAHARRKPAGPQKRKRQRSSSSSDTTSEDAGVEHKASYDETSASSLSQSSTTEDMS